MTIRTIKVKWTKAFGPMVHLTLMVHFVTDCHLFSQLTVKMSHFWFFYMPNFRINNSHIWVKMTNLTES